MTPGIEKEYAVAPYSGYRALSEPLNVLEVLDGVAFPASKMELIAYAQDHDASEDALDLLQSIPDDIYSSIGHVNIHINDIEIIEGAENIFSSESIRDLPGDA